MHLASLTCFKMSETCLGENLSISKRKKTRRWKPRSKENRKYINEFMRQRKHRVAPSNTTQFLMEDREKIEPILNLSPSSSLSSADEESGSEIDMDLDIFNHEFFLNDFEKAYRKVHRDNLNCLSKCELMSKVKNLESHLDNLEKEKLISFRRNEEERIVELKKETETQTLENELKKLKEENRILLQENMKLKKGTSC
ncbi:protein HEXIM1-like [Xenia sp. Carnegie-2017]|uniref:protein HEXIM1-like n=1 Tax=Xenia sp. Carnegie-2017 TaxID=2897299 RepID=UPI001F0483A0|nr:protein HEXIM1-like [Xenia sp. Carnegie-2017]